MDDLRAGVLRTVGAGADRFREDYLRILRALRFAGRFELAIEPSTWEAA
ncbi:MAG: CCA tRNA nucleotidyltransferase, partial [Gemmatimonadetes bacterium]|nr:CCA tRNA nucleotidyltransferase [Gemmatimonadota bacterium]